MKICFSSDTYPPDVGGLAVSARRQAHGLAAADHTIHLVCPGQGLQAGSVETLRDGRVTIHRLGSSTKTRETLSNWLDLLLQLDQQEDFNLFHGHFLVYSGYLAALEAKARALFEPAGRA